MASYVMRFDARSKLCLELSERVLIKCRKPEENEEVMTSGSSKDACSSGVSIISVRMESRPCSKSATAWSKKE